LARLVGSGGVREDRCYRLSSLPIGVPPLRCRTGDIEILAKAFLKQLSRNRSKRFTGFSPNALRAMSSYRWPGNVRELRSVIERAVILEKGPLLELSQLRQESLHAAPESKANAPAEATVDGVVLDFPQTKLSSSGSSSSLSDLRKEMDEKLVRQVLLDSLGRERGNVSAVARSLKLDRANLLRLMKRFGIDPELFRRSQAS